MSFIKLEDTAYFRFCTVDSTGAAVDADALPTVTVEEDGTTMGGTPATVADAGTGIYRVTVPVTDANGYEAGKRYNVMVSATVDGIASSKEVCEFLCTARYPDDLLEEVDAEAIAEAVWDFVVETPYTAKDYMRGLASATFWKLSGALARNPIFKAANGIKSRIIAVITPDGRTSVTFDPSD